MTKDDHYKIGLLIAALCAITWMFLSDAWGADPNESINRDTPACRLVDHNGGGYPATADYNDRHPSIYPGTSEIFNNGIDPGCNGLDRMASGGGIGGSTLHSDLSRNSCPGVCLKASSLTAAG